MRRSGPICGNKTSRSSNNSAPRPESDPGSGRPLNSVLILASSSAIRRQVLRAAGVEHDAIASAVDENVLKAAHSDAVALTRELAEAKALSVSRASTKAWVIGSDSVASVDGRLFDKAE